MTTGTRNLIKRLRQHMNDTQEAIRREKIRVRTPFSQCQPPVGPGLDDLKQLASLLCAARAEMRSKQHFKDLKKYLPTVTQVEWIKTRLEGATRWEAVTGKIHPTLPSWMRHTILAALQAAQEEPKREENRQKRWSAYKKEKTSAA